MRVYENNNNHWVQKGSDLSIIDNLSRVSVESTHDGTFLALSGVVDDLANIHGRFRPATARFLRYATGEWQQLGPDFEDGMRVAMSMIEDTAIQQKRQYL